jgi:hypothetical protein
MLERLRVGSAGERDRRKRQEKETGERGRKTEGFQSRMGARLESDKLLFFSLILPATSAFPPLPSRPSP